MYNSEDTALDNLRRVLESQTPTADTRRYLDNIAQDMAPRTGGKVNNRKANLHKSYV